VAKLTPQLGHLPIELLQSIGQGVDALCELLTQDDAGRRVRWFRAPADSG
jgi:hypothetical protein